LGIISKLSVQVDIVEWLGTKKKEVSDQLASSMHKDKNFLFIHIFTGISHRSSSLSGLFLFIVVQLLNCYDVAVQKNLRASDAGLMANITSLASSKFIHTQYAARRLFATLLDDPWRDFFLSETDKAKNFFEDLTCASHGNSDTPSLVSTLMLSIVDSALVNLPANKDQVKPSPSPPVCQLSSTPQLQLPHPPRLHHHPQVPSLTPTTSLHQQPPLPQHNSRDQHPASRAPSSLPHLLVSPLSSSHKSFSAFEA
jgi:hypothetical protein